jgi:hypothetical protein
MAGSLLVLCAIAEADPSVAVLDDELTAAAVGDEVACPVDLPALPRAVHAEAARALAADTSRVLRV